MAGYNRKECLVDGMIGLNKIGTTLASSFIT